MQLSTQPYKGTKDFFPEDQLVQNYIFNVWREVCLKFGYKEYQTPLLESADIYRAKSGEDVGGKELFTLRDLADRELAIRPEMTPSITRLVARIYNETPKPIRLFNISNFCRNERPQKGRNREFWQLNADIFGEESINADIEILSLAIELVRAFNPPSDAFILYFNNRKLIDSFLNEILGISPDKKQDLVRLLDKFEKYSNQDDFVKALVNLGLEESQVTNVMKYLASNSVTLLENFPELETTEGAKELIYLQESMTTLDYQNAIQFKPNIIRGFDYYDGIIFEVFDTNPENNRSLFGGGRYNGLGQLFGIKNMPAVGFAPGNETFRIFLENWNLLPDVDEYKKIVYFPILEKIPFAEIQVLANVLRGRGKRVQVGTNVENLNTALRNVNKWEIEEIAIYGQQEKDNKEIILKNMRTGNQENLKF